MKKKILIIEDTPEIVEALEIILQGKGFETTAHTDGETALHAVQNLMPHVILLDALLAGVDGPSIAKLLKAEPQTAHIPIILISAHPALLRMAEESNVDGYLPKPFSIPALLEKINGVLHPNPVG